MFPALTPSPPMTWRSSALCILNCGRAEEQAEERRMGQCNPFHASSARIQRQIPFRGTNVFTMRCLQFIVLNFLIFCYFLESPTVMLSAGSFSSPYEHLSQPETKRMVEHYTAYLSDNTRLIANPGLKVRPRCSGQPWRPCFPHVPCLHPGGQYLKHQSPDAHRVMERWFGVVFPCLERWPRASRPRRVERGGRGLPPQEAGKKGDKQLLK